MILCLHHVDHDGHTAAAIVKKKYPDVELFEINYGIDVPWDLINKSDTVIIVDFSLPIEDMQKIDKEREFIWIDHHKSIIDEAEEAGFNPQGIRFVGKSGCRLAWEYFFPGETIPVIVDYLARWDVHDFSDVENPVDSKAIIFEYGMRIYDTHPNNGALWNLILNDDPDAINAIYNDGKKIWMYQQNIDAEYLLMYAFDAEFEGLKALVVNNDRLGSLGFLELWDNTKYDIMMSFTISTGGAKFSIYTDKDEVDVIEVAKKFGGGGHEQAAGFTIEDIGFFFDKINIINPKKANE
jgi:hypothetical protein